MALTVPLQAARDLYRTKAKLVSAGVLAARQSRSNPDRLLSVVVAFQLAAIRAEVDATTSILQEQDIPDEPVAALAPAALAGVASDGRNLGSLLTLPDLTNAQFDRIVATQLQDVARQAAAVERAVRPNVAHYVRAVNLPACGRCIILAGRPEADETAFRRHPNCFPAGVVASGPNIEASSRRWYDGELVVFTTAGGEKLSVTGNHPVLTRRGWVAANLLREGDEVLRSTRPDGATPLVVPDHHQVPSLVEDIWDAMRVNGLVRVPTTPQDFHGDGVHGEVDIAYADASLRDGFGSSLTEHLSEELLADALVRLGEFVPQGTSHLLDLAHRTASSGSVGGERLSLALLDRHLRIAHNSGLAAAAALNASFAEDSGDRAAGYPAFSGEGVFAGASQVGADDLLGVERARGPRWDASGFPGSMQDGRRDARVGMDLALRLAGQVEVDRVVDFRRVEWSGHVYSLTSSEGWLSANRLIVSNCDCTAVPTTARYAARMATDPREAFEQMDKAEREKAFTKAGAEAIRLGADPVQVVNARRGMVTAQGSMELRGHTRRRKLHRGYTDETVAKTAYHSAGRAARNADGLYTTREGVSSRRGRRQMAESMRAEGVTGDVRLMPESIMQIASTDAERLRLLRAYGYIRR